MSAKYIIKEFFSGSVKLISPKKYKDSRGYFSEVYNKKFYKEILKIKENFIQDNISYSKNKFTIRGMHLQTAPYEQSKLISVIQGSIEDYFVDLRSGSKTFGKYNSIKLNSKNRLYLFIDKGFAHGFKTLEDKTIINYKVSNFYSKKNELTLHYQDETVNINWKLKKEKCHLSKKDLNGDKLEHIIKKL